ncbi:hypothetical protein B0H17DRAFT_1193428 [Mycena rosella]|uniref:Uncharacterized protein n=1 Tax=Mycena rosella TaxID=1033263 RepID=A0AAD7GTM9_MYCRO|nr:hypothetical protein B0H17DRAFT_1193428 [Mycena rosella]
MDTPQQVPVVGDRTPLPRRALPLPKREGIVPDVGGHILLLPALVVIPRFLPQPRWGGDGVPLLVAFEASSTAGLERLFAHQSCDEWVAFRIQYQEGWVRRFHFQFWEHLGNGDFVQLEDDPRLEDLNAVAATWDYRVFCYNFQPLLNTRRSHRRRADRAPRSSGKGKTRARTESESESESESDDERRPSPTRTPPRNPASPLLPEYTPVVTLEDVFMDVDPVSPPPSPSNIECGGQGAASSGGEFGER